MRTSSLLVILAFVFVAVGCADAGPTHTEQQVKQSLSAFIGKYFDQIDKNGDGILVAKELEQAKTNLALTLDEHEIFAQVQENLSSIGHVIDTYTTEEVSNLILGPQFGMLTFRNEITHEIYGISREDVVAYSQP